MCTTSLDQAAIEIHWGAYQYHSPLVRQHQCYDMDKNPVQHKRTKHIYVRHHFLRDNVEKIYVSNIPVTEVEGGSALQGIDYCHDF